MNSKQRIHTVPPSSLPTIAYSDCNTISSALRIDPPYAPALRK